MKKILLILLSSLSCFSANAQWSWGNLITFDPGDVLYPVAISIDTTHYHHNIWQIGTPHKTFFDSAYSYPNAIVTDTLNPYPINDTSAFVLKIPGRSFNTFASISFYYQLDIDTGAKAIIEISLDSGTHWINLIDSVPPNYFWNGTPNLDSSTNGWTQALFRSESPFIAPETLLFRFTFISSSTFANKDGWIIDNINVCLCWEGVPQIANNNDIALFPNPAYDELTIQSTEKINNVEITNLIGQTIYTNKFNTEKAEVDVAAMPAGIYFVKVNNTTVRKFVKE